MLSKEGIYTSSLQRTSLIIITLTTVQYEEMIHLPPPIVFTTCII